GPAGRRAPPGRGAPPAAAARPRAARERAPPRLPERGDRLRDRARDRVRLGEGGPASDGLRGGFRRRRARRGRSSISSMTADYMPLDGWDHVALYVGTAKQAASYYEQAMGFARVADAGP